MTIESLLPATRLQVAGPGYRDLLGAALTAELVEIRHNLDSAQALVSELVGPPSEAGGRLETLAARRIPRWHFPMLNDDERNDAFATALERAIKPGDSVLDIGSGTGLLAMLAVQAGAGHVVTCEADPLLAEIARQVIAANGMSDMITVLTSMSTDLVVGRDLPQLADVLVTEIVDCGLIGEGLLPTILHAREHLLQPGATLIPSGGRIRGALLSSPAVRRLNRVGRAAGFNVDTLNRVSTPAHFPVRLGTWPHEMLSDQRELVAFDLVDGLLEDGWRAHRLPVVASGLADGLVAWFEMDLGHGIVLRNAPDNLGSHWMQAFLPFAQPIPVEAGEDLQVDLRWDGLRLTVHPHHQDIQGVAL